MHIMGLSYGLAVFFYFHGDLIYWKSDFKEQPFLYLGLTEFWQSAGALVQSVPLASKTLF